MFVIIFKIPRRIKKILNQHSQISCEITEVARPGDAIYDMIIVILQMSFSNAFSWIKMLVLWLKIHRVQLTESRHWSRQWCGTDDKPLPEPMMTQFMDLSPQCINPYWWNQIGECRLIYEWDPGYHIWGIFQQICKEYNYLCFKCNGYLSRFKKVNMQ